MSNKIGKYSLSKDRSTVYFNDAIIFQSDKPWIGPDLYAEDGEVCFYDGNTRSIYRAKENSVECIYYNVSYWDCIWKGNAQDGKTVILCLINETSFKRVIVSSKDYSNFHFENYGYYISENDFEMLMHSYDPERFCLLSNNGIYDFPRNFSDVRIHYNYLGNRVVFYFDNEKKILKVIDGNDERTLYKQPHNTFMGFDGKLRVQYPTPRIKYQLMDDDIIRIQVEVYRQYYDKHRQTSYEETKIVYYDNHMPKTYKEIQTPLKDYKDTIRDYLFYPEDDSKKAFVLKKLFEGSGLDTVVNSGIEDDSSVNHLVKIWDKHYTMEYALLKGSYNASKYRILGVKLISLLASTEYAIKNRMWELNGYNLQNYFFGYKVYPREIARLKEYYGISDGELFWFLKKEYLDVLDEQKLNYVEEADFKDYQKLMDDVLLANSYYVEHPSTWKSEFMLYKYIKEFVSDTVYQAQPKWLRPQSLDVFIESKSIGIEYQGIQHFQPVEHFGGNAGYIKTVKRDENKRQKCAEHGVQLLYWNYQEEVTKLSVKEFLENNGIIW